MGKTRILSKSWVLFLLVNFACLWLSHLLMDDGPRRGWYQGLEKAPWTPPNWAFGLAWSVIMVCFAVYMRALPQKRVRDYAQYGVILSLCMLWNLVFFSQQQVFYGLIILVLLTSAVFWMGLCNIRRQRHYSWFILPFMLWVMVATSLNAYVL